MTPLIFAVCVGTFGAILQELLFWYNARTKLETDEYRTILTSPRYWVVVTAMALGSGVAAYLWFAPAAQEGRTYLLFGAAFPVLFKKAVDALIPAQTRLGAETEKKKKVLQNYFKVS